MTAPTVDIADPDLTEDIPCFVRDCDTAPRLPKQMHTKRTRHYFEERLREIIPTLPNDRDGDPWTPAEDAIVLDNTYTMIERCYILHRGYHQVEYRRSILRHKGTAA